MKISQQYIQNHLEEIAVEQLAHDYTQKGYDVKRNYQFDNYRADLVASNDKETIVIEIKTPKLSKLKNEEIKQLGQYVRSKPNHRLVIALAIPPQEKHIKIDNIEEILRRHFLNHFPDELDELSSHTQLDDVTDVEVEDIHIINGAMIARGKATLNIELQYASDRESKDTGSFRDAFPFDFALELGYNKNGDLTIINVDELNIDTSTFYN